MRCRSKGDAIPLLALFKKPRLLRRGVSLKNRRLASTKNSLEFLSVSSSLWIDALRSLQRESSAVETFHRFLNSFADTNQSNIRRKG